MTIITKAFTTTVRKERDHAAPAFKVETGSGKKQTNNQCKRLVHIRYPPDSHSSADLTKRF